MTTRTATPAEVDTAPVLDQLAGCWQEGRFPTPEELAALLSWPLARTERRLRRLEAVRLVYRHRAWGQLRPGVAWERR